MKFFEDFGIIIETIEYRDREAENRIWFYLKIFRAYAFMLRVGCIWCEIIENNTFISHMKIEKYWKVA